MRIRRRGAGDRPHAQAAPSAQTRPPPAPPPPVVPAPASAPCSGTAAGWVEPPVACEPNPSTREATAFDHRPPSDGRNRQEEAEGKESDGAPEENEKEGKEEERRSEREHGGHVDVVCCSASSAPKGEEEERRAEASEDSTTRVKDEEKSTTVAVCKKGDGKGWHCKRAAQSGYSLCQYHLDKLRSYGSRTQKRKPKAAAPLPDQKPAAAGISAPQQKKIKRRRMEEHVSRTTEHAGGSDSFYYYSGFGPRWGKRRGDRSADDVKLPDDGGASDQVHPLEETGEAGGGEMEEEEDEYDCEGPNRDGKPWKSRPLSSLF